MSSALILRRTDNGKRLMPIDRSEADLLVEKGGAKKLNNGVYETLACEPDVAPDEEPTKEYETKVMTPRQNNKRRGRSPSGGRRG